METLIFALLLCLQIPAHACTTEEARAYSEELLAMVADECQVLEVGALQTGWFGSLYYRVSYKCARHPNLVQSTSIFRDPYTGQCAIGY